MRGARPQHPFDARHQMRSTGFSLSPPNA